ncbi:MAG: helix-turn-helix domain-containing protein [Gammaproteobacteria bacterium]
MTSPVFSIVPIEAARDRRLTKLQLQVLLTLLSFRGKNTDVVWPSRQAICDRCGLALPTISKVTTQLVNLGWLLKDGKGGHSRSTRYRILVPDLNEAGEPISDDQSDDCPEAINSNQTGNGNQSGHQAENTASFQTGNGCQSGEGKSSNNGDQSGNGCQSDNGCQSGPINGNQSGDSTVSSPVTRKELTKNLPENLSTTTDARTYPPNFAPSAQAMEILNEHGIDELMAADYLEKDFAIHWGNSRATKNNWDVVFIDQCIDHHRHKGLIP